MACLRCGRCCVGAFMVLESVDVDPLGRDAEEIYKWLQLHGCRTKPRATINGLKLGVEWPQVCLALDFDAERGLYQCTLHGTEKKPKRCREYLCVRAKADGSNA